jgi:hypothetical protein
MVTLIKEAVFPPGSCGCGVVEASFEACGVWLETLGCYRDGADDVGCRRAARSGREGRMATQRGSGGSTIKVQVSQEWQRAVLEK